MKVRLGNRAGATGGEFMGRMLLPRVVSFLTADTDGRAQFFIRLAVGLVFFSQGILKYTDPHMGILRFTRIGFPFPDFTAHFVGTAEILCGFLVLIGWWTRLACLPLVGVILTAIATTKIPELFRPEQGFWFVVPKNCSIIPGSSTVKTCRKVWLEVRNNHRVDFAPAPGLNPTSLAATGYVFGN